MIGKKNKEEVKGTLCSIQVYQQLHILRQGGRTADK
jgi:hypothetical protein